MTDAFSELMTRNDGSVVIVTTVADGERSGCLVGFHSQASIEPVRYAVWISKANHTHRVGMEGERFAVHWVPSDRRDLAELFGGATGDDIDKFAACAWTAGDGGVPVLDGCPDRFIGRRTAWIDTDTDHSCVILEPLAVEVDPATHRWLRLRDVADITAGHPVGE
jgi:flavin reductase (DIM6/NTAB) family NADH-FMN oxidoreductase RutF